MGGSNGTVRCLVISDVHANLTALQAVLNDVSHFDMLWCLGDLVGYGPDPNECVAELQKRPHFSLAGNHDWAVLGKIDLTEFNRDARAANLWTRSQLSAGAQAYLAALPVRAEQEGFTLVHGSPREPVWEYVLDTYTARVNFAYFDTAVCLVGHSHIPLAFEWDAQRGRCRFPPELEEDPVLPLSGRRLILNPGSVGQPRDGDPRAAYAVLDTDAMVWEFHRVEYDIESVQERMQAYRLPPQLIERLAFGL